MTRGGKKLFITRVHSKCSTKPKRDQRHGIMTRLKKDRPIDENRYFQVCIRPGSESAREPFNSIVGWGRYADDECVPSERGRNLFLKVGGGHLG